MKRSGINRKTGLTRSTRLRYRSASMAGTYEHERIPLVERLLRERPWCELRVFCNGDQSVDVHEVLTRGRAGSITDPANCLTACRKCHDWVTAHPREANCLGCTVPSWAGNVVSDPMATAAELRATRRPCPWGDDRPCPSPSNRQRTACDAEREVR